MVSILASKQATIPSLEIGKKPIKKEKRLFSNSVRNISKSIETISLIDSLMSNMEQLTNNELKKTCSPALILIDSVNYLQSLAFMLNDVSSSQAVVNCLSVPDGNMSNKHVDCLLNW